VELLFDAGFFCGIYFMPFWRAAAFFVASTCLLAMPAEVAISGGASPTSDQTDHIREKEAFESAKELGTADAWNAFIAAFPIGFYADLARAYLKHLSKQPGTTALAPSSARATARPCSERSELRSEKSNEPTKITFVNKSGAYRSILWINSEGDLEDFGNLSPGAQRTLNTYRTHPWMIATAPGDCLQIYLPAAEPSVVELLKHEADEPKTFSDPQAEGAGNAAQETAEECAKDHKLVDGKCVLQSCGKNASRTPAGDCHCNKGYVMKGGKCVWPQDKQGFEVAPQKNLAASPGRPIATRAMAQPA
jgi:hypothetical protein